MKVSIILLSAAAMLLAGSQPTTFTGTITDSMCVADHAMMHVTPDAKCVRECVKAGAPEEILTEAHPHIGTFRLVTMVESLRETIEGLGGEYRFRSKVADLLLDDARSLRGVKLESGEVW